MYFVAVLGCLSDIDVLDDVVRLRIKTDGPTRCIDLGFQHRLAQRLLARNSATQLLECTPHDLRANVTRNRVNRRDTVEQLPIGGDERLVHRRIDPVSPVQTGINADGRRPLRLYRILLDQIPVAGELDGVLKTESRKLLNEAYRVATRIRSVDHFRVRTLDFSQEGRKVIGAKRCEDLSDLFTAFDLEGLFESDDRFTSHGVIRARDEDFLQALVAEPCTHRFVGLINAQARTKRIWIIIVLLEHAIGSSTGRNPDLLGPVYVILQSVAYCARDHAKKHIDVILLDELSRLPQSFLRLRFVILDDQFDLGTLNGH